MRTVISVLGGAALLAGCASGTSVVPPVGVARQAPPGELLAVFRPPPGAVGLAGEPPGVPPEMSTPGMRPVVDHLLIGTSWWSVAEAPQQAEAWFVAHPPAGTVHSASAGGSGPDAVITRSFDFPDRDGYQDRSLMMSAVPYRGGALLRVDALEVHVGGRSAQNEVPSGVSRVEVRAQQPGRAPVVRTVTEAPTVRRITGLTNDLSPLASGTRNCPQDTGGSLTLTFYMAGARMPAVTVTVGLSGCRDAIVTTPRNQSGTALDAATGGYGAQVLQLSGIA